MDNPCAGGHDWATTGLWIDGTLWAPCKRVGCSAAVGETANGWRVRDGVFPPEVNGISLDIEDDPAGGVAKVVMHEMAHSYLVDQIDFRDGDVVLDIGAHVGIVSCYLGKRWPGLSIFAYEPMAANYRRLVRNLGANGVTNVLPVQQALSGNGRTITLIDATASNSGGSSAYSTQFGRRERVQSVTLTDIWASLGLGRVRLLKIDCEGAEYETLLAEPALLDKVDYLVGEFHENATLERMGYNAAMLLDAVGRHIPPEHVHVTRCQMGA